MLIFTLNVVEYDVLQRDDITFGTHDFGDMRDLARAIAQTRSLDHHIDGADDHFLDRLGGQVEAAHGDHAFNTRQGFTRAVGMQRAHETIMAGVHG